jgi:hypothetical protein
VIYSATISSLLSVLALATALELPFQSATSADENDLGDQGTAVVCSAQIDNPHYTPRAGGVISKIRVACRGTATTPTVSVQIEGILGSLPGTVESGPGLGPPNPQVSTTLIQDVTLNGDPATYYLPPPGNKLPQTSGWYEASAQGRIVNPPGVRTDNWMRPTGKTAYVVVP